jgi:hypothetical protein
MGGKPRFGSFLVMNQSSVIVFQIHVDRIAFDPTECRSRRAHLFLEDGERARALPTLYSKARRYLRLQSGF